MYASWCYFLNFAGSILFDNIHKQTWFANVAINKWSYYRYIALLFCILGTHYNYKNTNIAISSYSMRVIKTYIFTNARFRRNFTSFCRIQDCSRRSQCILSLVSISFSFSFSFSLSLYSFLYTMSVCWHALKLTFIYIIICKFLELSVCLLSAYPVKCGSCKFRTQNC